MIHSWSVRLAGFLAMELNLGERRQAVVAYGLEVLIGALIKVIIFIAVPCVLGVFNLFMATLLSAGILRLPSGGVHCSAYYRCLVSALTIHIVIAFAAQHLATFSLPALGILYVVLSITFITFLKLAPVDVKEKPILSTVRRKNLKIVSCSMVIVYFIFFSVWQPAQDILLACSMGIMFQTFNLTRAGHKFFNWIDAHI
jgi:accessory gene regulator B